MTESAMPGTLIEGHNTETTDGHVLTTMATDEQTVDDDGQANIISMGERMGMIDVDSILDEQPILVIDEDDTMMVLEVDPLLCPMPTYLSAGEEEAVLSPSTGSPMKSVSVTPVTPRRDFLSAVESSSPAVSGLGGGTSKIRETNVGDVMEVDLKKKKKVIGRRLAVVEDDGETQTSECSSSIDGDALTTASSSRVRNKGTKRGRGAEKDLDFTGSLEEESSESRGKKKGKKRKAVKKDSPEEVLSDGECGEPKGIVDLLLEEMSSSVLGGSMMEWVNRVEEIRVKSRKFQGRLSGEMKKCMGKIKEGTALLVARAEATGDPQFLRLRNSELDSRLLEVENENVRLKEQLRKLSLGPSPPRRKRKVEKGDFDMDRPVSVDTNVQKGTMIIPSPMKDEFPPLPQRTPRKMAMKGGSGHVLPPGKSFLTTVGDSEGNETGAEAYFTQHISFLTAMRDLERKRREQFEREKMDLEERREGNAGRDGDRNKEVLDGVKKVGPRIVSNVQVAPPFKVRLKEQGPIPMASGSETEWKMVTGGKRGRRGGNMKDGPVPPPLSSSSASRRDPPSVVRNTGRRITGESVGRPSIRQQPKVRPPRPPVSSAVTITGKSEGFPYAAALKNAREHINLEALGIKTTRVRKAINGGMLIEVSGEDSKAKAEELVTRLRGLLKDSAVVSCPIKKREVRVVGFDESVTSSEIAEALGNLGGCSTVDIKMGPIRTMNNGLGVVWAQLPVAAAVKITDEGRIRIGWTVARVELLRVRPLQCYRCWEFGHVQSTCRNIVDRRGACFRCGQKGHMASVCKNPIYCVVCHDLGLEASHRLGGPQCAAQVRHDALMADRRPLQTVQNNV